ncbi:MAG: TetR/AcrR family transcriptional regulator [Streptomycetaceae bacterium]|nr:TetR/AcrR family transcriptional regulator [Streptomycetaceae bacterium]
MTGSTSPAAVGNDGEPATARRADARLNRERLLTAAREVFAESGPDASLNEVARRAGVGPGTLYRHFPNRQALVAAVIRERVDILCAHAARLAVSDGGPTGGSGPEREAANAALAEWLTAFVAHARLNQGLGAAAMDAHDAQFGAECHRRIADAAGSVLARAQREGTARADVTVDDLVRLVVGVALSPAQSADAAADEAQTARLLALVLDGVHADGR